MTQPRPWVVSRIARRARRVGRRPERGLSQAVKSLASSRTVVTGPGQVDRPA